MNFKQRKILRLLVKKNGQRYSCLYKNFEDEDKFPYHLKQLLKNSLVSKRDEKYFITSSGVSATSYFDSRSLDEYRMKIPRLQFVCCYKNKFRLVRYNQGDHEDPCFMLPGCNFLWGESLEQAFTRVLRDNYEIEGDVTYRSCGHNIMKSSKGQVFFDDVTLIFDVDVRTQLKEYPERWFTLSQIKRLTDRDLLVDRMILEDNRRPFWAFSSSKDLLFEHADG